MGLSYKLLGYPLVLPLQHLLTLLTSYHPQCCHTSSPSWIMDYGTLQLQSLPPVFLSLANSSQSDFSQTLSCLVNFSFHFSISRLSIIP